MSWGERAASRGRLPERVRSTWHFSLNRYKIQKGICAIVGAPSIKTGFDPEMNAVQLKMARVALGLTVRQTAEAADVSHDTITRLERGEAVKKSTAQKVKAALEDAGVDFIAENGGGAGVRLRKGIG